MRHKGNTTTPIRKRYLKEAVQETEMEVNTHRATRVGDASNCVPGGVEVANCESVDIIEEPIDWAERKTNVQMRRCGKNDISLQESLAFVVGTLGQKCSTPRKDISVGSTKLQGTQKEVFKSPPMTKVLHAFEWAKRRGHRKVNPSIWLKSPYAIPKGSTRNKVDAIKDDEGLESETYHPNKWPLQVFTEQKQKVINYIFNEGDPSDWENIIIWTNLVASWMGGTTIYVPQV